MSRIPAYGPDHHPGPSSTHTRDSLAAWEARANAMREPRRRQPGDLDPAYLALMERRLTPDRMSPAVAAIYARTAYGHDEATASDFQADAGY